MSLTFNGNIANRLTRASAWVSGTPLTMGCMLYIIAAGAANHLIAGISSNTTTSNNNFYFLYEYSTGKIGAGAMAGGSFQASATTTTLAVGTWGHACSVWASPTSRSSYLNGGGKNTVVTSLTPASLAQSHFGAHYRDATNDWNQPLNGYIAEFGVWNVALSDAEVASLAAVKCPLLVRRDALIAYYPFGGLLGGGRMQFLDRWKSNLNMTQAGSNSVANHPIGIVYPRRIK